jgi:hypothetical protein
MAPLRLLKLVLVAISFSMIVSFGLLRGDANRAPAPTSSAGPRTPVLIELFTSEGCSSCPPADVLLGQLDRFQPVPGADAIVLSEHVDYWDDIGWKDPYSARQFSLRQGDYARRFRLEGPYTPQMIVDGVAQLIGSDEHEAFRAIASAATAAKIPVSLSMPHLQGTNSLVVHIEVKPAPSPEKPISGNLLLALADDSDQSNVRRGENAGRTLRHVAVVRTLTQVGTVEGNQGFSKDVTVNSENASLRKLRIVAIVQESAGGRVLGVAATTLSN